MSHKRNFQALHWRGRERDVHKIISSHRRYAKTTGDNSLLKDRYMKEGRKKVRVKKGKDPLFDLRNIAVETGIKDLAEHHDHYLYGVFK